VVFTWDDRKNRANQQKHGIGFETAILVFDDPLNVSTQDREVDGEPRWQTIGMVNGIHMLIVAHTLDLDIDLNRLLDKADDAEVIRILSARKATRRERRIYAQGI
jgi:uncharacterized DUF497 family protein